MKKLLMFLMMGMFFLSFASAISSLEPVKQGECVELFQFCDDCTYSNLTGILYPNGTTNLAINEPMTKTNLNYNYTFCDTNALGKYSYFTTGDKSGTVKQEEITFEVTPTGETKDNLQLYSRIFLILLTMMAVILIQRNSKKINYDKWYDKMANKWQERNWVKFGLSALAFNLMKNSWIFSYLVGLLGLLILTELTYFFNITSVLEIMKIVLGIYSWSAIAVALIFFSQVQEWIAGWLEDLQNLKWGFEK